MPAALRRGPENWYRLDLASRRRNRFTVTVEEKPKDASGSRAPLRLDRWFAGRTTRRRDGSQPRRAAERRARRREQPSTASVRRPCPMPIQVGDRLPQATFRVMTAGRAGGQDHGRSLQGPQGGARRRPRRLHPDLPPQPPARLRAEGRRDQGQGRRRHRWSPSVNDVFVMDAWAKASGGEGIEFLADGNADFAKAIGLPWTAPASASAPLAALRHGRRRRRGEGAQRRGRSSKAQHSGAETPEGSLSARIAGSSLRITGLVPVISIKTRRSRIGMAGQARPCS